MGPETLAALKQHPNPQLLNEEFVMQRILSLPQNLLYLQGQINRINRFSKGDHSKDEQVNFKGLEQEPQFFANPESNGNK